MSTGAGCEVCGRPMAAGIFQVNVCRAFVALAIVDEAPGLTAWELSKRSGITYADISEGLNKARANSWVEAVQEDRDQGGIRYRYSPLADNAVLAEAKRGHRAAVRRMVGML